MTKGDIFETFAAIETSGTENALTSIEKRRNYLRINNSSQKVKVEKRFMKHVARVLFALYGMLVLTVASLGQTGTQLRGQVVDELNAVIPGANVVLISPDGKQRTAVSSANGEFTFPNVVPGIYTVTVGFKGFQPYSNKEVKLPVTTGTLRVEMVVEAMAVETDVKSDDNGVTVEPDANANATVLGEDFIKTLPDNEDDLRAYLQALAGPAAGGAAGGQDGAQIFVNGFTAGRLPPREAIMQIRIAQNPFAAEYSRPGAGRIDIITKPGNDTMRGSASFNYRNSATDARNAFAVTKPLLDQRRFGFNLSGPIIKKKMSYFFNIERRNLAGESPVIATTLDGPYAANVAAPSDNTQFNGRVDYLLNNKNTISLNYSYSRGNNYNREFSVGFGGLRFAGGGGGGFGGFGGGGEGRGSSNNYTLPERGSDGKDNEHSLQISDTWIINSRLIHEARLQFRRESSDQIARTLGLAINVTDAFEGGGSACCPNSSLNSSLELQDYLTYTQKKHTIKGGFQLDFADVYSNNSNNFNGTYSFSSLDIYRLALAGLAPPPGGTGRSQFTITRGNPELAYNQAEMAWFIQDDYRLSQSLTLSAGLRHEFQTNLTDKMNFAPRLSLAWSPFKDRKTTVRLGGGMFYSRFNNGLTGTILRYSENRQTSIYISNPKFPDPFEGNPNLTVQNTVRRVLDPDIKAPYVINFNGSVERQLPKGLVGSLTYIYTRGVHQFRSRNLNAPLPGTGLRPDPTTGNVYNLESTAYSKYNGLLLRVDRRFGQKFTVFGNYSLSFLSNDSTGATSSPMNNYDLASEWGRASGDRRHSMFIGGSVTLPKGFRINPMLNASTGAPFNITTGLDDNRDTVFNDRPAGIARNADLPSSLYSQIPNRCILNCGVGLTPVLLQDFLATTYPNGVIAQSPGLFILNTSISKTFGFGKRDQNTASGGRSGGGGGGGRGGGGGGGGPRGMGGSPGGMFGGPMGGGGGNENARYTVTFTAQISNILNKVNLSGFGGTLGSPYFGRANSSGAARSFEFGARFGF